MKTVKKENEIKRVTDSQAEQMVARGWEYCSKSEWKVIRDSKKKSKKKK